MSAPSKEASEKQHVEPQRILEIVTSWKATLNEAERQHMNVCGECVALFVRFMDEQST
jgi:hypothetical protein